SMTEQLAKRLLQRLRDLAVAVEVKAHDLEHFGNPNSFTLRSAALVGSPAETRGNVAACRWCVRHGPNRVGLPAGKPHVFSGAATPCNPMHLCAPSCETRPRWRANPSRTYRHRPFP